MKIPLAFDAAIYAASAKTDSLHINPKYNNLNIPNDNSDQPYIFDKTFFENNFFHFIISFFKSNMITGINI